jgi:predicted secreted protein
MFMKKSYKKIPAILLLICLVFLAGNSITTHAEEGIPESKPVIFTTSDANSTASVKMGKQFQIVLECQPSTGYVWQVIGIDKALVKIGRIQYRPKTNLLGGVEEQIISFTALKKGKLQLELQHKRPWEGKPPPEKVQSFILNIDIIE